MNKEKMFVYSLSKIAIEREETSEMIYKEFYSKCMHMLQFQRDYINLDGNDISKQEKRIERNHLITSLFKCFVVVNNITKSNIFDFEMPFDLRPLERGRRIDTAIQNILSATRFVGSDEVQKLLRECK